MLSILFAVISFSLTAQTPPLTITTGPDLGTFSMGTAAVPLSATGGTPPYSWSVAGGAPPDGMSIRTDFIPPWLPAGTDTALLGVATTPGNNGFTLRVQDSAGAAATRAVTMRISALIIADDYTLPDGFLGSAYNYGLRTLGGSGAVSWGLANGTLPPGLSLNPATGQISGTPAAAGNYGFVVWARDSVDTVYRAINSLRISTVQVTSNAVLPNAMQYAQYTFTLSAAGGSAPYTWTGGAGLPPGIALASNGVVPGRQPRRARTGSRPRRPILGDSPTRAT